MRSRHQSCNSAAAEDIDWGNRTLAYTRKKTGSLAMIHFGTEIEAALRRLPASGPLFPYLRKVRGGDRATEFRQRCDGSGIKGVTLHSYRYAWTERAKQCGYPERFAQIVKLVTSARFAEWKGSGRWGEGPTGSPWSEAIRALVTA